VGKAFDVSAEYNKTLYQIKQSGNSEVIGLAHTDLVGDDSTESFADMWESGLVDKSLYINPETGEKLPKDNEWMKDEANSGILSQLVARHITNGMHAVSRTNVQSEVVVSDEGLHQKSDLEKPDKEVVLPKVTVSDTKVDKEPEKDIDTKVDEYLKPDKEKLSDKVKTMPPKLFDRYMKRLENQLKKSKKKDKKSKKEWKEFLNKLPGGDYYNYVKQMRDWRKNKLTPAELIKKYS
jgi:hypothetical protein